jgi:hypothetical protein
VVGLGDRSKQVVGAYDLSITYDPALLSVDNVSLYTDAFGIEPLSSVDVGSGLVDLSLVSLEDDVTLGNLQGDAVNLVQLTFLGSAPGHTSLTFAHANVAGLNALPLAVVPLTGDVTVVPVPSVHILFGVSAFAMLILSRRKNAWPA